MTYDINNIFNKILQGDIPCDKVYEDEFVLSFNDITPQAKVHVLVIPKGPYKNYSDFMTEASDQEIIGFNKGVQNTIELLPETKNGYRLITNNGEFGQQEVPHFHVHILSGQKLGSLVNE